MFYSLSYKLYDAFVCNELQLWCNKFQNTSYDLQNVFALYVAFVMQWVLNCKLWLVKCVCILCCIYYAICCICYAVNFIVQAMNCKCIAYDVIAFEMLTKVNKKVTLR